MSRSEISHFCPFLAGPEWEGTFSKFKEKPSHICFETADVGKDPPPNPTPATSPQFFLPILFF